MQFTQLTKTIAIVALKPKIQDVFGGAVWCHNIQPRTTLSSINFIFFLARFLLLNDFAIMKRILIGIFPTFILRILRIPIPLRISIFCLKIRYRDSTFYELKDIHIGWCWRKQFPVRNFYTLSYTFEIKEGLNLSFFCKMNF
jgi:hypothetical protein